PRVQGSTIRCDRKPRLEARGRLAKFSDGLSAGAVSEDDERFGARGAPRSALSRGNHLAVATDGDPVREPGCLIEQVRLIRVYRLAITEGPRGHERSRRSDLPAFDTVRSGPAAIHHKPSPVGRDVERRDVALMRRTWERLGLVSIKGDQAKSAEVV